jgi:hypothetical protein
VLDVERVRARARVGRGGGGREQGKRQGTGARGTVDLEHISATKGLIRAKAFHAPSGFK